MLDDLGWVLPELGDLRSPWLVTTTFITFVAWYSNMTMGKSRLVDYLPATRVGLPEGRDPGPWPVLHHTGQHRRTTRRRRTMAASANESQQKATNRENLRLLVEWMLVVNRGLESLDPTIMDQIFFCADVAICRNLAGRVATGEVE